MFLFTGVTEELPSGQKLNFSVQDSSLSFVLMATRCGQNVFLQHNTYSMSGSNSFDSKCYKLVMTHYFAMATPKVNFVHIKQKKAPNRKHKVERLHSKERERDGPERGGIESDI